jgi:SAM-dependent methyltransferase
VEGATPAARIDPVAVKRGQAAAWDAISSGWELALGVFERGAASMTERLLELGGVRPGQSVLDVGTGLGEPALPAARAVGPAGRVVGVDISPAMLEVARRRACAAGGGAAPVDFVVADLESIDLPARSFDVALSRWGLMFALDHVAALRTLRGLLVPGGVLAAAVWSTPQRAPMMSMGYSVLAERLELPPPPPGMPGPFSMADPERVAGELAEAGFAEVSVTEFVVSFRLDSPQEYAAFTRDVSPPALLRSIRDRFGSEDDPGTWEAVAAAAARHAGGGAGGLSLPSTALCLRAVAPRI